MLSSVSECCVWIALPEEKQQIDFGLEDVEPCRNVPFRSNMPLPSSG